MIKQKGNVFQFIQSSKLFVHKPFSVKTCIILIKQQLFVYCLSVSGRETISGPKDESKLGVLQPERVCSL